MNETIQTVIALATVLVAVGWLAWQAVRPRRRPGCGGCGPVDKFKARLKPAPRAASRPAPERAAREDRG